MTTRRTPTWWALLTGATVLVGASAAWASAAPTAEVAFRFADPEIAESSGLVVDATSVVTVNDSGDTSRIFTVDPGTGRTVGVTRWNRESVDNEALAPAGDGRVWVGDIGDNRGERSSVSVTRVPYGAGERAVTGEVFELVYPDGPADAEALLAHPATGQLFVVTKGVTGGAVWAAPEGLRSEAPNELVRVADAPALVTGGEFAGADRVVLRSYGRMFVLGLPSWRTRAAVALPAQEQGEALAVGPEGAAWLSSEGGRSTVLRVPVPEGDGRSGGEPDGASDGTSDGASGPGTSATAGPTEPPPGPNGVPQPTSPDQFTRDPWQWLAGTAVLVVALVALVLSLRPPGTSGRGRRGR